MKANKVEARTSEVSAGKTANLVDETDTLDRKQYEAAVRKLLAEEKFEELDRIAANARSMKARFPGGEWKLYTLYLGLCGGKCNLTAESDLLANIEHLKRWVSSRPESITARVGLADAYFHYAWHARGDDYSDTVTDDGWRLYGERLQIAREVLESASRLKEKCPQWYLVMQHVLRSQNAKLGELGAIVEKGSSVEPLYQYFYGEHAFTLGPKWYGVEGDSERYAVEVAHRIGGKQGAAIYFDVASVIHCPGCTDKAAFKEQSWPRVQEGYAALNELYGSSNETLNQFALLAVRADDRPVALDLFMRIGDNWDKVCGIRLPLSTCIETGRQRRLRN